MVRTIFKAKTSRVNRAAISAPSSDTSACRDLDNWPRSWMGLEKDLPPRGRTGCWPPAVHRASGFIESLPEDHWPARGQPLDARWRNHSRLELHTFFEKSRCAATSSRCGSCRWRPTDPQRLGRGATLLRRDLPQTPPLPQSTSALSPSVTHRFPRRGKILG
jgi:hypothetical protein